MIRVLDGGSKEVHCHEPRIPTSCISTLLLQTFLFQKGFLIPVVTNITASFLVDVVIARLPQSLIFGESNPFHPSL